MNNSTDKNIITTAITAAAVGGKTLIAKISAATIDVQAALYSADDVLGLGNPVEIEVFTKDNGTGILQSVTIGDLASQNSEVEVIVFGEQPSGTYTDQAIIDVADADLPKVLGVINIQSTDYSSFNDSSCATKSGIGLPIKNFSTTDGDKTKIWLVFVDRTGGNFAADSISCNLGILQD